MCVGGGGGFVRKGLSPGCKISKGVYVHVVKNIGGGGGGGEGGYVHICKKCVCGGLCPPIQK